MVIVPKVNISEEFYNKLNKELNIRFCINDNAFSEFRKVVYKGVNIIITTYNTAFKCISDLVEEVYNNKQRLDYFL